LDYMLARHYDSSLGRFVRVDPSRRSVHAVDPQSWSRYTYARNSPVVFLDPNGRESYVATEIRGECAGLGRHMGIVVPDHVGGGYTGRDFGPGGGWTLLPSKGHIDAHSGPTPESVFDSQWFGLSEPIDTTAQEEIALLQWWDNQSERDYTYWFLGRQCQNMVALSLSETLPGFYGLYLKYLGRLQTPEAILAAIREFNLQREANKRLLGGARTADEALTDETVRAFEEK